MFANPVAQKYIRPFGTPDIPGDFHVTAPFGVIDPSHPIPHGGVDIGNGKCGEPLLAMATGKITMAEYLDGPLGSKTVLTVRGIGDANPDHEWAIAHCASLSVKVGQRVTSGQRVGVLGSSGATACHAHLGLKVKINGIWVSRDIWPYLDQNQESNMVGFKAVIRSLGLFTFSGAGHALISPVNISTRYPQAANSSFNVFAVLDLKTPTGTPIDIDGHAPPLNNRDQVYLVDAPNFGIAAYALRQDGTFVPRPLGHTDEELAQAVAANEAKWEQWVATHP